MMNLADMHQTLQVMHLILLLIILVLQNFLVEHLQLQLMTFISQSHYWQLQDKILIEI